MQDVIDRQAASIREFEESSRFASEEIRAWLGNWSPDAMDRMRKDFIKVASAIEQSIQSNKKRMEVYKPLPRKSQSPSVTRDTGKLMGPPSGDPGIME